MRNYNICYSGRGDYHLLRWLSGAMENFTLTLYSPEFHSDIVVVLGDRYEAILHAVEAIRNKCVVAHIHGGEVSKGSMDDMYRDAITKLAHYHFPATEQAGDRIVAMGEDPGRVHVVGSLGVEMVKSQLHGLPKKKQIMACYHPNTVEDKTRAEVQALLQALDGFPDYEIIITEPNTDPDSEIVESEVSSWASVRDNVRYVDTLGESYISHLQESEVLVGNSSSGIIEAPSCSTWTVNVGDRQKGRERGNSVIDVGADVEEIIAVIVSITRAEYTPIFTNPYDRPGTREAIASILESCDLTFAKRR